MLVSLYCYLLSTSLIVHIFSYIQPPPPGYAPTQAQQAYAQGQQIQVTRQKKDMWGGGSDGGMSIW